MTTACLLITSQTISCEEFHSPSLKMGTMSGFICARYTIAHIIQQQTVAVITNVRWSRLAEGPRLQQILVQRDAIIPITAKIRVVTKKPISQISVLHNNSCRKKTWKLRYEAQQRTKINLEIEYNSNYLLLGFWKKKKL